MGRAPCCDKATVKKGPWSAEEDAVLKAYIEEHGTGGNWIQLPHKIGLNRCGKSCRLRWLNYLRPNIRHGGFTKEEDNVICSLYISVGSRWSTIAAQLPGRTDNDVKNHWNTKLKRRLLGSGRRPRFDKRLLLTDIVPRSQSQSSFTAASALERMQLGMRLHRRHDRLESRPGAFTLYNYGSSSSSSLWPSPSLSPSPSPAASDCSEMQLRQLPVASSTGCWSHMQSTFSYACSGAHETLDGTCTPQMSTTTVTGETAAVGMESSSSTPTASSASATFGSMEDEIDMLLRQIQSFEEDGQTTDGVDRCFGAVDHVTLDGSTGSWSSCSTPGVDSVFQDFVQGYNQYS